MEGNVGTALLLTAAAGLSTTIGSVFGLAVRKPGPRFMGFTLGFSAGVMILVSFVELLQGSIESIGFLQANIGFFVGMSGIFLIDMLVPHEYIGQKDFSENISSAKLARTGMLVAFGIGIHTFPDGMATFDDRHYGRVNLLFRDGHNELVSYMPDSDNNLFVLLNDDWDLDGLEDGEP